MQLSHFNARRFTVQTASGPVSYCDIGEGPTALFVHGVLMSSFMWSGVMERVLDTRRCIAIDLPAHGLTQAGDRAATLTELADLLDNVCEALKLGIADVVANDTGGAVSQIFAARHPERLRSLTLTNCDVHDHLPPQAFQPVVDMARAGQFASVLRTLAASPENGRMGLGQGLEDPAALSDEAVGEYFAPSRTEAGARAVEAAIVALQAEELMAVEPALGRLEVPTLIAWGTNDVFFSTDDAEWLARTIPGARPPVHVAGAKLFWPTERPDELARLLREFWTSTVMAP